MPVAVRNCTAGPSVFFDEDSNLSVNWAGAGDPSGEDIQYVPETLLDNAAFRKAMNRGIFAKVDDESLVEAALTAQREAYVADRASAEENALAVLDDRKKAEMTILACVGPGTRGQLPCGSSVPVRTTELEDNPPLCATHKHLAHQYELRATGIIDPKTHQPQRQWERIGASR